MPEKSKLVANAPVGHAPAIRFLSSLNGAPGRAGSEPARGGELGGLDQSAAQLPVRKAGKRGGRLFGIGPGAAQRFRHAAALLYQTHRAFQIARTLVTLFERAAPEFPLFGIAAGKRDQDRQRDLAIAKIVADRFAQ